MGKVIFFSLIFIQKKNVLFKKILNIWGKNKYLHIYIYYINIYKNYINTKMLKIIIIYCLFLTHISRSEYRVGL